ncbi:MAG: DNA polymerase III subunit delta' [Deltaproteobacteria bacterium]
MGQNTRKIFVPFSQIIGQDRAIRYLKEVIARAKMPHAYLFVGIPGVGKTTTAVALAQAVNCQDPIQGEACGRCQCCRQVESGNFADLEFIEPTGQNIKIEQIRQLDHAFGFKPLSGRLRVTIIRHAETMTVEAANAFLKTLEEPPPGNMLILSVTEPMDLLPTIVSRCQKVAFRPLPAFLIREWLMNRKGMEEGKAAILAKLSEGSLGNALDMLEKDFLQKREEYLVNLNALLRRPPDEALEAVLQYTGKEKRRETDAEKRGDSPVAELLGIWKTWYRDLLVIKTTGREEWLINSDFLNELKKASQVFNIDKLVESFLVIDRAERDYWQARNVDLMIENTVLGLRKYGK